MKEQMLRLIKDGKIVGYQRQTGDRIEHSVLRRNWWNIIVNRGAVDEDNFWIRHDSFDLGIKVGDEWWFVGDTGEHAVFGKFTLSWDGDDDSFYLALGKSGGRGRTNHAKIELDMSRKTGNTYDKDE